MDALFGPPLEEIVDNRLELRKLFPESRLLDYLTVCDLGDSSCSIIYLSEDLDKRDEFERRFGDFRAPGMALFQYNLALKNAIEKLNFFRHIRYHNNF